MKPLSFPLRPPAAGRASIVAALSLLWTGTANAQDAPPPTRPTYKLLRQYEDWSFLADPEQRTDPVDRVKYMRLSDDGKIWFSMGGEIVSRFEVWRNFNGGTPPGVSHDDEFLLTRLRLHGDLHWGENARLFGELKSAHSTDRDLPGGRRTLDMDTFALQQLFIEYSLPVSEDWSMTLRPGRQMLQFGAERLVSPLPWGNTLRTWDGVTVDLDRGPLKITAIATAFAPVDKTEFNDTDTDELLYGIYGQTRAGAGGTDLYWLGAERPDAVFNGTLGDSNRQTLGVRRFGAPAEHLDAEVELSYQFGEVGQGDVNAWSVASQAGYRPGGGSVRSWVGLDWASGDKNPGGNVQTFDQLYPLGHAYFGYLDAIGRQNAIDTSIGTKWTPHRRLVLALIGHSYWVDSKNDAIYNAGGGILRRGPFQSSWIGWELNATATWTVTAHILTEVGLGRFFLGDAMKESGPPDDIDFAYLSMRYAF